MEVAGLGRAVDWPLIGRDREVERVAAAWQRGSGGVVLAGEAGVGKSRVAREALRRADALGHATAAVIATRAAAELPLGALAALLPIADTRPGRREDLIQRAVAAISGPGPGKRLMLLVDDAHLLDAPSAAVLLELTASNRAFVVATVRTGLPAPDAVVALWREGIAERIEVENLGRRETEALVATALGGAVDGSTLREFWDASRGTPLVLRELVLGALESGLLRDDGGLWLLSERLGVPPSLAELIAGRLAEATPEAREVLEILAVGEPLALSTLVTMTSPDAVDTAERRGLLTVSTAGERREVRLAHPLHGEVLRSLMTALRTVSVHRLLAEAVEADRARSREDALRLALWRLEGGGDVRPDLMVEAARRAYFTHDDLLAERLARAALAAGGGVEATLMLGEVLGAVGRHAETVELLAGIAADTRTDAQRAIVAKQRADSLFWGLDRLAAADAVLLAAEEELADPAWRQELAGVRATFELLGGRPRDAFAAVEPVLSEPEGRAFVQAAVVAIPALAISGRTRDAVAVADRALAIRQALGDQPMMAGPGIHFVGRVVALGEAGHLEEAMALATEIYEDALDARNRSDQGWAALVLGRIGLLQGRLVTAARSFREGAAAFSDLGEVGQRRWCLAGLVLATTAAGDVAQADAACAALDALPSTSVLMMEPEVERARGWNARVHDDLGGAARWFRAAADRARAGGAFALEVQALHDLARAGVPEAAAERLAELTGIVDGELAPVRAAHARALVESDAAELDRCTDAFGSLGALLLAAEAAASASSVYRRRGAVRQAQRASQRSVALTRRCEAARTPALALVGEVGRLTRREREIAELAAAGLPSAEIADRIVVGRRTVESHLQRVYTKLGVHSRSELAAALADGADANGAE